MALVGECEPVTSVDVERCGGPQSRDHSQVQAPWHGLEAERYLRDIIWSARTFNRSTTLGKEVTGWCRWFALLRGQFQALAPCRSAVHNLLQPATMWTHLALGAHLVASSVAAFIGPDSAQQVLGGASQQGDCADPCSKRVDHLLRRHAPLQTAS